jgi:replicative DNA helicase
VDIERALVSKIISTGQLEDAISKGIKPEMFADPECRSLFIFVMEHQRRYKTAPSINAVKLHIQENTGKDKMYQTIELEIGADALDWLIDKFIILCKRRYAQEMVVELAKLADDPKEGENIDLHFLEVSRKLATLVPSTEVARFSDMEKRITEYEQRVKEGRKVGITFGFPTLDQWTGGIQPHEFVTIAGFSGLGKSTMLMILAFKAWVAGYTPLYVSLEMEKNAILRKFDAMAAALDYRAIKQLDLPEEQIKNWREIASRVKDKKCDIPVIDSIRGCTPDHIFAETVRHKPDLVIVDYLSLMQSARPSSRGGSSMWQGLTEITQDLKQNARTLKIPIVAAAQTNRSGGKDGAELDNIGYSISVVQDSDIVIGLFADDEMKENRRMQIRLNKNRDGRLGKFNAIWDHEKMDFRQADLSDMFTRTGGDAVAVAEANGERLTAAEKKENAGFHSKLLNGTGRPRPRPGRPRPGGTS